MVFCLNYLPTRDIRLQPRPHLNEAESEKVEGLELAKKKKKEKGGHAG